MPSANLLDQFSTHLKQTIANGISIAAHYGHGEVQPAHLLLALFEEEGSIAEEILQKSGIKRKRVEERIVSLSLPPSSKKLTVAGLPILGQKAKQTLEKAMLVAYKIQSRHVGTEHLLSGLTEIDDRTVHDLLEETSGARTAIRDQIATILESTNAFPDMDDVAEVMGRLEDEIGGHRHEHHIQLPFQDMHLHPLRAPAKESKRQSAMDLFTINLTDPQKKDRMDPVVGRDRELARLMHIMGRRHKNNPLLIGEAGVGKTAIVEGFAKRILEGSVPPLLRKKKIHTLDLTRMVAGTIYRGEFEARLKQLMEEVARDPNAVLFIDEMHTVIGAGSSQGTLDAANILKPALARGEFTCIGATTIDEYKKSIANDPALARRFQPIMIEEPSSEETVEILRGIKSNLEAHHHVVLSDEAVRAAVRLSASFLTDRHLPDKAIDLLDESAARLHLNEPMTKSEEYLERCQKTLATCLAQKERAISLEQFDIALQLKKQEKEIQMMLRELEQIHKKEQRPDREILAESHVIRTLADMLGLEEHMMTESEWERIERLKSQLKEKIIGQEEAVERVVNALKRSLLTSEHYIGPKATILFVGPPGVGKTELAKVLARELYHTDKALLQLNMSEFAEGFSISKILGSPAGYVGYRERNHFLERIQARPSSVVLFDEFDKAHPDVRTLLLQILDEGFLTDSLGKKVSFRHAVIVLTTNTASELFRSAGIGFEGWGGETRLIEESVKARLKEEFGAPLLSRLSEVCLFHPLSPAHLEMLVQRSVEELNRTLEKSGDLRIQIDKEAQSKLARTPLLSELGARHVRSAVEAAIHPLVGELLGRERRKKEYRLVSKGDGYALV